MKSLKLKNSLENFLNFDIQYEKKVTTSFSFFFIFQISKLTCIIEFKF